MEKEALLNPKVPIKGSMDDKIYFEERLLKQIEWHRDKATENKEKYKKYKALEFILAASIPVVISLTALGVFEHTTLFSVKAIVGDQHLRYPLTLSVLLQILVAGAGVWLAIVNKRIELESFYQNWKDYRTIEEQLENQRITYLTGAAPYSDENAFPILVENVENILSNQVLKWQQNQPKKQIDSTQKAFEALATQQANWSNEKVHQPEVLQKTYPEMDIENKDEKTIG